MNVIQPDIDFIKEIKKDSGSSLKECMQCGNCSVVCELSPEENPYPRKEMNWASWGLKEKLLGNPDIWLCHQCGDCSAHCPRGVDPSNVLASIRKRSYMFYARPRFIAKMLDNHKWAPLMVALPSLIIFLIISIAGTFKIPDGPVNYSEFFPHMFLNISFTLLAISILTFTITGIKRFCRDLKNNHPGKLNNKKVIQNVFPVVKKIFFHREFGKCNTQIFRQSAHFMVFWGFVLLLVVTFFAIIATFTDNYPLKLWSPVKLLSNFAALILVLGLSMMILKRLFRKDQVGKSSYSDWAFLLSFLLLTLSGIFVEMARFLNWHYAYHIYFIHLVFVWIIVIYAPYTKFGHLIYRTVALLYIKMLNK